MVPDTLENDRFQDNPLVEEANVRFYAGAPLTTEDGFALGTICFIDTEAHNISAKQIKSLP